MEKEKRAPRPQSYLIMRGWRPLSVATALQGFQVLRIGSVVLGSVLLARSPLGLAEVGRFEAMLFAGTVAAFFWANGLLQGIMSMYHRVAVPERPVFLFQVFALFVALSVVVCGLFWACRGWLLPTLTGQPPPVSWGWFLLHLFAHLSTLPLEQIYALQGRGEALWRWGLLSFGGYVLVLSLPAWAGWSLADVVMALAVLGITRGVWCAVVLRYSVRWAWQPLFLRRYVLFSAPLVLNLMVGQAIVLFDGWLVGWYFRDEAVFALYRYGSRELPLALALASGLGTALVVRVAEAPTAGLAEMRLQGRQLFHRVFPVSIGLLFLSPWLFRTLFGPAFEPAAALFNIYLLLTISRVLLPNTIALAHGHSHTLLTVGVSELIVKVVLGFFFVRWWGLQGIAWSAVLSFFWEKVALTWYVHRRLGIRPAAWLDTRLFAAYSAVLLLAWVIAEVWLLAANGPVRW